MRSLLVICTMFAMCHSYALNLQDLVTHQSTCVKTVIGEKIYFQEKALHPSPEGIYIELDTDGNCAVVPEMGFDGQGYFLHINESISDSVRPNVPWYWTCPQKGCGYTRNGPFTNTCKRCGRHWDSQ